MRRLWVSIAVLTLVAVLAGSSRAQVTFAVGPRVGFNLGSTSLGATTLQPGVTKGGRFGMIFGATNEVGFDKGKMFFVVLELMYIQKGFSIEGAGTQDFKFNYLNIPLYFKVKFLKGMVRPYAFLGPDLGIMLSATRSSTQGGQTLPELDLSASVGTDFSLDFGGGAEIAIASKISIIGDVRYMLGLKSVYSNVNDPNLTMTPSGLAFVFGALFQI